MKEHKLKYYIIFWLSQSVSQLGSSMTSFALILWVYKQTNSAMSISLLTFFTYMPHIVASFFAGAYVDSHKKKFILLWSDSVSFACSVSVMILIYLGKLEIWHIYFINMITGFMGGFQSPASAVAIGLLVPEKLYSNISGMTSFSSSLITVVTPMLAAFVSSFWNLGGVLFIDMLSFSIAFTALAFFIKIPEERNLYKSTVKNINIFNGCKEGILFLLEHRGILNIILSFALINFLSRLTYENILPAMILARSGGNEQVLGIVSGALGLGGIIGGLIVSIMKMPSNAIRLIYFPTAISFLFGDILIGLSRSLPFWIIAALAASIPIPFISAGNNVILYKSIPREMQGRVFAAKNALQQFAIPIGILLGGALADYVFEPFMKGTSELALILGHIVGTGDGSGMAAMFLCTGILGFISSMAWYRNKEIQKLQK